MRRLVILVGLPLGICVTPDSRSVQTISSTYTEPHDDGVMNHTTRALPTVTTSVLNDSHLFDKHDVETTSLATFTLPHKLSDISIVTMSTYPDANADARNTDTVAFLVGRTVTRTQSMSSANIDAAVHANVISPDTPKISIATQNVSRHPSDDVNDTFTEVCTLVGAGMLFTVVLSFLAPLPSDAHYSRFHKSMWLPLPPGWLAAILYWVLTELMFIVIALAPSVPNLKYLPFVCSVIVSVRLRVSGKMSSTESLTNKLVLVATAASSMFYTSSYPMFYSLAVVFSPQILFLTQMGIRLRGLSYSPITTKGDAEQPDGASNFVDYIQSVTGELSFLLILLVVTLLPAMGVVSIKIALRYDFNDDGSMPHMWLVVLLSLFGTIAFACVFHLPRKIFLAFPLDIALAYELSHTSDSVLNLTIRSVAYLMRVEPPQLDLRSMLPYQLLLGFLVLHLVESSYGQVRKLPQDSHPLAQLSGSPI